MATLIIFRVWQDSWIFDFFKWFFWKKIQHKVLNLEIHWFFPLIVCGAENRSKVKNIAAKAGKTRVWNELQPKLFHQHLALNKGLLEKWCWHKLWPLDLWRWAHLFPKKAQIEQKVIIIFVENWKEIRPWFWLIWIAGWLFLILTTLSV